MQYDDSSLNAGIVQPKERPHYNVNMRESIPVEEDLEHITLYLLLLRDHVRVRGGEVLYPLLDFNSLVANIVGWF